MSNQLLTPDEVAGLLNLHIATVRQLLREKRLPGIKIGVFWRVREDELHNWIAARSHDGNLPRVYS